MRATGRLAIRAGGKPPGPAFDVYKPWALAHSRAMRRTPVLIVAVALAATLIALYLASRHSPEPPSDEQAKYIPTPGESAKTAPSPGEAAKSAAPGSDEAAKIAASSGAPEAKIAPESHPLPEPGPGVVTGRFVIAGTHPCAMTYDDGPGEFTAELLDILAKRSVKATFFVLGELVEKRPELVKRMIAEGHEVGNHSFDHPDFKRLAPEARKAEIEKTDAVLSALGVTPRYFRPPYGSYDAALVKLAAEEHMVVVLWSRDSQDWMYHTLGEVESHALPRLPAEAGGIFLFHDIHKTTVASMPDVLDGLAKDGCEFLTVSQWIDKEQPPSLSQGPAVRAR